MKKLIISIFLAFGMNFGCFAANNATDVYLLAQSGDAAELKAVENIDVVDSDGNTALCSAIKFNDVDAYNILKKAGANTEHKCVKKIPSEQYKTFLQKVGAANKSWSFLGMGKWAWAAIGAGVAGGAVAAGMGGGGGGSGGSSNGGNGNNICQNQGFTSHEPCIEEDGWTQDRFCEDSSGQWYKCKPANCFGYQNSCNDGYEEVPGDTCKSGGETKVKCQLRTCPYQTTYCETGYHETGNTCLSGILTYVECEPDTCEGYNIDSPSNCPSGYVVSDTCLSGNVTKYKCDTPATCPYNTTECTGGWDETGNTCQSGETLYKECSPKMCPYTTTTCLTGFYPTGNTCQSGDDTYVECVFDTENYIEQDGNIYQRLNCVHGTQNANTCSCNSEGWEGDLCDTPHNCGSNYVSACLSGYDETGNTCLSGDSILVECEPTQCGANAHWEGTACVCDSGYGNYTYGVGCSLIPLNCVHGTQNGISCSCTDGWTGNLCDTAVDCGANFTQTSCSTGYNQTGTCNSGETTYVSCEPATCPYNTTSCTAGYHETGATCQSGETLYKECEPDTCEGFNYTEMESCPNGYELGSSCLSGTIMKYKCDTPATCPYTTTECTGGYTFSGETCQSGETTYIECEQIQCGVHSVWSESGCSCENGYQNWTPGVGCYPVSCGLNATQFGTDCYCNPGYTNWTVGYGCYQTLDCGVNATQVGDSCVCNSGYQDWTEGYGCYETRDCGLNATQSGGNCVCNSGYQEWTEGYGCYQILNCGANATQHGDSCQCNEGYENWSYGTGCTLIELECGINAVQNGTHCECLDGFSNWQEGIGCYLYGLFSDQNANLINNNYSGIVINNNSNGSVYDIYGMKLQANENYHYYAYNAKIEGTNQYWNYVNDAQHHVVDSTNTKVIRITNEGDNDIYGMHVSGNNTAINADSLVTTVTNGAADEATFTANGNMYVTNTGDGNIYGLYGKAINAHSKAIQDHNVMWFIRAIANGHITITNTGDGDMYGMYNGLYNAKSELEQNYGSLNKASSSAHGYINITNTGDGDVYGMYGTNINNAYSSGGLAEGHISINNTGNGNVYGMSGTGIINNANSSSAGGAILIRNDGTGNVYGMHTNNGDLISNGRLSNDSTNTSITIINKNNGLAYGMYNGSTAQHTSTNGSEITMQNLANGDAIGMYTNGRTLTNSGTININNVGTGTVIGILGNNNSNITNTGTINITRDEYTLAGTTYTPTTNPGSTVFGIYAKSGSTVNNSGTINITSNGSMYGIYTESGATITNTGTISLNGVSCDGATCSGASNYIPYIVLNGGTLYNSGLMMAPQMNLNSMGGNVVAGLGSQFVVDNELSGDLNISSELVQNGNQTTYIAENMIDAGDISNLNVRSASAMFAASLADNGHDVVMQMKDFGDLTDNKSLAAFLANNYANGKGQDLFSTLKSMDNMSAFNGTLSGLTGLSTFTQFAHEDLSAMREISFSMNNKLFENSDRDSFDVSDSTGYFSFSNSHNSGSGQYGISSEKIAENWKLGYGMAMANINTGDGDNMHRQNKMWLFYMPATYTNDGYELVVAPKAGFANSEYSRRGYNNINYEGYIEKRIFGLMNDLRYPLSFGNWTLAPDLAFNAIVYDQSGNEDGQEFSLVIPDDRTVSVETGFGLYTKYEKTFESGARLKLNSGLMAYREFGDMYNIKLGIRGMDGTFNLYNNDYTYRGAASLGLDYMAGKFHLYGNAQYFMDNDNYMNFKGGVSYRF